MSILKILQGKEKNIWKLEDRINKVHEEIDSNKYLSIDELNSLSNSIAHLKYNMNKGSLKKAIKDNNRNLNYSDVGSLISKIDNYRNDKYDVNINDNKYVNEINQIYNNKELNGNKFYYLNDRFSEIETRIDKIDTNDCSLKDIDSLNYILISMQKDSYMKQKSKKDKAFYETKKKLEKKIKNTINKSQKNLNQYTKSYHLDDEEIEEAKDNKVTIGNKKRYSNQNLKKNNYNNKLNENEIEEIATEIDNEYDNEVSKSLGSMAKWLKYGMIGVLGLCGYELGSQYIGNQKHDKNHVIQNKEEKNDNEIKNDTLLIDDFNYENDFDSLINDTKNELKEKIKE